MYKLNNFSSLPSPTTPYSSATSNGLRRTPQKNSGNNVFTTPLTRSSPKTRPTSTSTSPSIISRNQPSLLSNSGSPSTLSNSSSPFKPIRNITPNKIMSASPIGRITTPLSINNNASNRRVSGNLESPVGSVSSNGILNSYLAKHGSSNSPQSIINLGLSTNSSNSSRGISSREEIDRLFE